TPAKPDTNAIQADSLLLYRYTADIAVVDVPSGTVHRVATSIPSVGYWISPDGKRVAYTALSGFVKNSQQGVYRVLAADVRTHGAHRVLVPKLLSAYGISVSWSPDGHSLAYMTFGQLVQGGDAYVVDAAGGASRLVTRGVHPPLGSPYRAPLWSADGSQLYFL